MHVSSRPLVREAKGIKLNERLLISLTGPLHGGKPIANMHCYRRRLIIIDLDSDAGDNTGDNSDSEVCRQFLFAVLNMVR